VVPVSVFVVVDDESVVSSWLFVAMVTAQRPANHQDVTTQLLSSTKTIVGSSWRRDEILDEEIGPLPRKFLVEFVFASSLSDFRRLMVKRLLCSTVHFLVDDEPRSSVDVSACFLPHGGVVRVGAFALNHQQDLLAITARSFFKNERSNSLFVYHSNPASKQLAPSRVDKIFIFTKKVARVT